MTDKIKVKMTRAEAIELIKKHMPDAMGHDRVIDFYIEAGMLEVVGEIGDNSIIPEGFEMPRYKDYYIDCLRALHKQGYKITKA